MVRPAATSDVWTMSSTIQPVKSAPTRAPASQNGAEIPSSSAIAWLLAPPASRRS